MPFYQIAGREWVMAVGFFSHNIEFSPDESRVPLASRGLNKAGNVLLSPVRHLLGGEDSNGR